MDEPAVNDSNDDIVNFDVANDTTNSFKPRSKK